MKKNDEVDKIFSKVSYTSLRVRKDGMKEGVLPGWKGHMGDKRGEPSLKLETRNQLCEI